MPARRRRRRVPGRPCPGAPTASGTGTCRVRAPASGTGCACTARGTPTAGHRHNPAKLLLDPYARAVDWRDPLGPAGLRARRRRPVASAGRSGGARRGSLAGLHRQPRPRPHGRPARTDRPAPERPSGRAVGPHRGLRGAPARTDDAPPGRPGGPARHLGGARAPGRGRAPRRARRHRGRAAPGVRGRRRAGAGAARDAQLLGLQPPVVLRPRAAVRHRGRALGRGGSGGRGGRRCRRRPARGRARGLARRRLQPHLRGGGRRADAVVPRDRQRLVLPDGRARSGPRRHRLRQHRRLLAPAGGARWPWTRCGTGCETYGVDGFRFDLAPALARGDSRRGADRYKPDHPFLVAARADPVLQGVKLVAEPWDVGTHGWRTGQFPPPFAEWNDRFRDAVRSFWLADAPTPSAPRTATRARTCATSPPGSPGRRTTSRPQPRRTGWPARPGRASTSCRRTTASPSPTPPRTTHKHNGANGEGNRDGHDDNRSWNHGVEGPTGDEAVLRSRHASGLALLSTLLLSTGTPMLARRRRDRPQPGRQQQRLLPRRRDHLGRLGPHRHRPLDARGRAPPDRAAA